MIVVPGVPSCAIELDGERFELQQLHVHHPAEHRIDGRLLDLELHFVHQSASGSMAILAVLARIGTEHEGLTPIVANLPAEKVTEITIGGAFHLENLLPPECGYFRYAGSRTMPPCDEGVTWLVLEQPIEDSAQQIDAITTVFPFNARPIERQRAGKGPCFSLNWRRQGFGDDGALLHDLEHLLLNAVRINRMVH